MKKISVNTIDMSHCEEYADSIALPNEELYLVARAVYNRTFTILREYVQVDTNQIVILILGDASRFVERLVLRRLALGHLRKDRDDASVEAFINQCLYAAMYSKKPKNVTYLIVKREYKDGGIRMIKNQDI